MYCTFELAASKDAAATITLDIIDTDTGKLVCSSESEHELTANSKTYAALSALRDEELSAAKITDVAEKAEAYCYKVLPSMATLREAVDEMETLTSSEFWPYPTYGDMLFKL